MPNRSFKFGLSLTMSVLLSAGCGARKETKTLTPHELLMAWRLEEARSAALAAGLDNPTNRAIVAVTYLAESTDEASKDKAIASLTESASDSLTMLGAIKTLNVLLDITRPLPQELSCSLLEVTLGSAGYGPLAKSPPSNAPEEIGRELAYAALERLYLAHAPQDATIDANRLLVIWNVCSTLLGKSMKAPDEGAAWSLFLSVGKLAVIVSENLQQGELVQSLLFATVEVIEENPSIAIAARCDLSSPFEGLRVALSHNRSGLSRLEAAVAVGAGCTRGTYAPKTP